MHIFNVCINTEHTLFTPNFLCIKYVLLKKYIEGIYAWLGEVCFQILYYLKLYK